MWTMATSERDHREIIFTNEASRFALSQAARRGTIRRISRGIYTRSRDDLSAVVRRNVWVIAAHEFPGAVVTDRCARRHAITDDGMLAVVHARTRAVTLPGLTIAPRRGPGPLPGDIPLPLGLWGASGERGILENLRRSGPRYLSRPEVEEWIVDLAAQSNRVDRLNDLRDRAKSLAATQGWERAYDRLNKLVSAALVTGDAADAESEVLQALASGKPYDRARLQRFEALAATLADLAPEPLPALPDDAKRRTLLPFYEAYFSNYIEGTEFTLDEAAEIVFDEVVPPNRPQDAHDIVGTYRLVADPQEQRRTPTSADQFVSILLDRHGRMLGARPNALPGRFKVRANQAGSTMFVAPNQVVETLRVGFEAGRSLLDPFARAAYSMFVVTEVHPFVDGNGRMARIMMNAELSAADQIRIIIPTVFRLNYLAALKGATHNNQFDALVATLRFAQRYTARVDFSSRSSAERDLAETFALRDPAEAEDYGIRLKLPASA
jgi:hypothetical protein